MKESTVVRRRYLPHWDVPGAIYFVTSCLKNSIPAQGLLDLMKYRTELRNRVREPGTTKEDWNRSLWKLELARVDQWLDKEPAVCHLADPKLATLVVKTLLHFAGQRYDVFAFVIMPSHFHWVFQPREEWIATLKGRQTPRQRIMKSERNYTSLRCNRHLNVTGTFWQSESYDHWVRDYDELERIILYIENNPLKANLATSAEDWPFSVSAPPA